MLVVDTLRGNDSTGVFLVDNNGNVDIAKSVDCGATFLKSVEWTKIRNKAIRCGFAVVGHNRKATRGTITDENAHPFWVEDKLVLVHNGSMFGAHKHLADTEVDSHAIAHVLAEEKDTEKALQKVNAAYALIWYEIQEKKLNIIRNKERPLHHAHSNDAWFFSSESLILEFALTRANVKMLDKEVHQQPEFLMSSWTLDNKKVELAHNKLDCTFRGQHQPVVVRHYPGACAWGDETYELDQGTSATSLPPLKPIFESWLESKKETIYDWQDPMPYGKFRQIRDYLLANDCQVRVSVADFDLALSSPTDEVLLIGIWANHDGSLQIPIVFPIKEANLKDVVDAEDTAIFYVTVKNHYWASNAVVQHKDTDMQRGYPYIWAEGAKPCVRLVANQQQVH